MKTKKYKEAFEKMGREVFSIHENGIKII